MSEAGPVGAPWTVDDVPERAPHVYGVTVDGEAVLLDEVSEHLHHLNASASLVWACLDGRTTVATLAREISDELGEPYDTVLAGTLTVLGELDAQELLAARGAPARAPTHEPAPAPPSGPGDAAGPRWRRRPDALWRRSVDAVLVLPTGADEPVTLTGSGPALWELLAEPFTVEQLATLLAEAFDAPVATVEADIAPVVAELVRRGALESV